MAIWRMEVLLRRELRGDAEHETLRAALPNLTAVAYDAHRPEAALVLDVEASSRAQAEEAARRAVVSVLDPGDIEGVRGADDVMQNRQVTLWLFGTRRQIRRWEVVLAANIKAHLEKQEPPPSTIWEAQIERHLALIAANNLLRSLENADGRFAEMPANMARDVRNQRDLQEHWDEQWPAFYNANRPGPLKRGGKLFASSHPGRNPYWFLSWNNVSGPELGPGLRLADVYAYLDLLEQDVLRAAPELARFSLPPDPSPWIGEGHPDEPWWPR